MINKFEKGLHIETVIDGCLIKHGRYTQFEHNYNTIIACILYVMRFSSCICK